MYWLDTTMLTLLALGAGLGFWSGFLWQVARIASLAVSLLATVLFNDAASQFLRDQMLREADPRLVQGIAYGVVFFVVYLILFLTTKLLYETIRATNLELADRLFGAAFGAGKMALVLGAMCLAAANYPHPVTHAWMAKSTLAPTFADGMEYALVLIPESYKENLGGTLTNLRDLVARPQPERPE